MRRLSVVFLLGMGLLATLGCVESPQIIPEESTSGDSATVDELMAGLSAESAEQRCDAIDRLAKLGEGGAAAVDELARLVSEDESPLVCAHAARALGEIGDAAKPAAEVLARAMTHEDSDVRQMAVEALAKIKPGRDKVVPLLLTALGDKDISVVLRGTHALAELGPDVVPPMIEALKDEKTAYWAVLVLHDVGPEAKAAVPAMLELLDAGQPETQLRVVEALGDIGDPAAIPKLIEVLQGHPSKIEIVAAHALAKFGPAAKDAEELLVKGVEEGEAEDDVVKQTVYAHSLAMIFPDDEARKTKAVELLVEMLKSDEARLRTAAAEALVLLDADPRIVRKPMLAALASADEESRQAMLSTIARLGEKVVPRLREALKNPEGRPYVATILGEIGPDAAPAVPDLVAALEGESADVRAQILFAIGNIGEGIAPAMSAAQAALADEDVAVQRAAVYVLGRMGAEAKEAIDDLTPLMTVEDQEDDDAMALALYAAWAIVSIDPSDSEPVRAAVPHLIRGLSHSDIAVRVEAAESLGKLGAVAKDAVAELEKAAAAASADEKAVFEETLQKVRG
ncbi:MAG: HEAT repeat domain-containing protein [Planctomycetota bacterium]|nr:MAG: HEAT repeat domain-containing protein [Planctomycetota bacterium]REJ91070.1 MAG: HEAT repeat domain-containing protein [Planctomycetota bacterium]